MDKVLLGKLSHKQTILVIKGSNFGDFLFASLDDIALQKGSTLKGEKDASVFSLKSCYSLIREATMKMAKFLPLKVYPFTIKSNKGPPVAFESC